MHRLFRRERIPPTQHGASDPRKGASPETRFHPGRRCVDKRRAFGRVMMREMHIADAPVSAATL